MSTLSAQPLRKEWSARALEVSLGIGLAVTLFFGVGFLHAKRAAVTRAQLDLEREPQLLTQQEVARLDLEKHEHDIARLRALFVPREAIDSFLNTLETEAGKHAVTVVIPDIKEQVMIGKDKKAVPQTGLYRDIVVTIKASGQPTHLLEYLHALEYLPVLLRIDRWELRTDRSAIVTPPRSATLVLTPTPVTVHGLLEIQLIFTVRQNEQS